MTAYYNEHEPFAAAWLRELIKANLIAPGEVDERSIEDVRPDDLRGFTQCHFFAGIGVWSHALRAAGWSDDTSVWTGSCPCQSFSASGKGEGFSDKRHLWPAWFRLISECRPDTIFGEQVSQKNGLAWFDVVSADMEGIGYAIGALSTSAAGVGAPHIRSRLYFVADSGCRTGQRNTGSVLGAEAESGSEGLLNGHLSLGHQQGGPTGKLADSGRRRREQRDEGQRLIQQPNENRPLIELGHAAGRGLGMRRGAQGQTGFFAQPEQISELGNAQFQGLEGLAGNGNDPQGRSQQDRPITEAGLPFSAGPARELAHTERNGRWSDEQGREEEGRTADGRLSFWHDAEWIYCKDGKYRPVKPGLPVLVNGTPKRVGRLRGFGNALVAPQAQAFIESYMEILNES